MVFNKSGYLIAVKDKNNKLTVSYMNNIDMQKMTLQRWSQAVLHKLFSGKRGEEKQT